MFDFLNFAKNGEEISGSTTRHPFDGWSLDDRNPKVIEQVMPIFGWFYDHYFRVQTSGWENLPPPGKMLLVGSHNGGLAAPDMLMFIYDWYRRFGYDRVAYGLMHPTVWKAMPPMAQLAVSCGALVAHPKMAIAALRRNAAVLVYPGGAEDVFRPYSMRHEIYFAGRKGFIKLALREQVPIVPCISTGAHETLIVLADYYDWVRQFHEWGMPWLFGLDPVVFPVYLGLPWGISFGPLPNIPLPVQIHTHICPPITFEKYGKQAANDRDYVDECFAKVKTLMQKELDWLIANS